MGTNEVSNIRANRATRSPKTDPGYEPIHAWESRMVIMVDEDTYPNSFQGVLNSQ